MDVAAPPAIVEPQEQERPTARTVDPEPVPRAHAVDLGVATFFRSGVASSGVVGLSPFVTDELGRDVFVRIAGFVGQAPANGAQLTWVAGRLDTCAEVFGNYAAGSGLRLDLCGGADVGASLIAASSESAAQSLPYIDIGPSVDLRAEVGPSAAILLRGSAGLSIARDLFVDPTGATYQPPLATFDLEVAFSWTLPSHQPSARFAAATSTAR
jgi:hypothetical protein